MKLEDCRCVESWKSFRWKLDENGKQFLLLYWVELSVTYRFRLHLIWFAAKYGKSLLRLRSAEKFGWLLKTKQFLSDYCYTLFPFSIILAQVVCRNPRFFTLIDIVRCQSTIPRQPWESWQLQSSGAALGQRCESAGRKKEVCFP